MLCGFTIKTTKYVITNITGSKLLISIFTMNNIGVYFFFLLALSTNAETHERVKVAVYEHSTVASPNTNVTLSRSEALGNMMVNLVTMKRQAERASAQGAKLLVPPEYGLYGFEFTRQTLYPYLEYIPEPNSRSYRPLCDEYNYAGKEVQHFLSCLARNTSMYIVANMGDRQPCNTTTDSKCPSDGHYQYNTNVVYNHKGFLVARYHKYNLFFEPFFDAPQQPERVTFQTPFGKFGTFTCYDILYQDPAVELIQNNGVRNIAFPTAWFDTLPHFSAIGFHSAFAIGWRINFLAANAHVPKLGVHGSGIYSSDGKLEYFYDNKGSDGRLLVSEIPILDSKAEAVPKQRAKPANKQRKHSNTSTEFQSYVLYDLYNFISITGTHGNMTVCHNEVCCSISYSKTENNNELYAFGAYSGYHTPRQVFYFEVCTLLKCKNSSYSSCGEQITTATTEFQYLEISSDTRGQVYPELMLSNNGTLALSKQWSYCSEKTSLVARKPEHTVLSASLISRLYYRD